MVQTQLALGYLGVAFIRSAQVRKNLLLTVDRKHETPSSAKHFARHAMGFMAFVAIPYMLERTLMENVGHYTFAIFANKVESSLRIHNLFPTQDAHRLCLLSAVASSNLTVGTYADQTFGRVEYSHFFLKRWLDTWTTFFVLLSSPLLNLLVDWIRVSMSCYSRDNRDLISVVFLVVSPEDQFRRCLNLWNHQTGSVFPAETCVSSWNPCQWTAVGSGPFASKHWLGFCTSKSDCTLESSCLDLAIVSLGDCLHLIAIWPIPWPNKHPRHRTLTAQHPRSQFSSQWSGTTRHQQRWSLAESWGQSYRRGQVAQHYGATARNDTQVGMVGTPTWTLGCVESNMGSARNQGIQSRRDVFFWFKVIVDS